MKLPAWVPLALVVAIAAAAGVAAGWSLKPTPKPKYSTVTVHDTVLLEAIPHVKPTLGERITKHQVKPTQVATSAGTPDTAARNRYCDARDVARAAWRARVDSSLQRADSSFRASIEVEDLPHKPIPILPPFSGRFADNTLTLQATRSDGSLWQADYQARPPFEWVAGHGKDSDTAAIVREQRWIIRALAGLKRDCPKGGAIGALAGLGIGALAKEPAIGAAVGAGAGCISAAAF